MHHMGHFRSSERASNEVWEGQHRFEHWYRDNQIYFITARCKDQFPALAGDAAKAIFWERFESTTIAHGFHPWVTSLLDNHYHTVGYLERGEALSKMMQLIHGGVAKLVNDLLEKRFNPKRSSGASSDGLKPVCPRELIKGRLLPFWCDSRKKNYFDVCLRSEK